LLINLSALTYEEVKINLRPMIFVEYLIKSLPEVEPEEVQLRIIV
jgi:hypothetical protein